MENLSPEEAVQARDELRQIVAQVECVIVGKRQTIELCLIALLARGHVLIEDVPGVGKTMLAKAFARVLGGTCKRLQFTPDLLPGDVTGLCVYSPKTSEFTFVPGPVFANVLLADEINRATPKTQSALLEAMEESQVTVDGTTHRLAQPFFVLATQNPVEYRGTYPLPEAQMDRFLMRVHMGYPSREQEVELVQRHIEAGNRAALNGSSEFGQSGELLAALETVGDEERVRALQNTRMRVAVAPALCHYLVDLAHATRSHPGVALGASPRGALALQRAIQAAALLAGREYATPDDAKRLAPFVLAHRLILTGESSDTRHAEAVVHRVLEEVAVP